MKGEPLQPLHPDLSEQLALAHRPRFERHSWRRRTGWILVESGLRLAGEH